MGAASALESLQKAVEEVTGPPSKVGCRVIADEREGSIRVYDLHRWTHECTELLRFLRPHARVSIQSSTQSLSGFLIRVTQEAVQRPQDVKLHVLSACAMLLVCLWWVGAVRDAYRGAQSLGQDVLSMVSSMFASMDGSASTLEEGWRHTRL